jgi:MFS family permease
MNATEWRVTGSLAMVYGLRMVGMFMVLPVLTIYVRSLTGASANWQIDLWFAFGAYGLMQACLQLPLGMLSDRVGRKPIIAMGLLVFAVGGVIAAASHTIHGVILGRAVQGCGAISGAVSALLADTTRPQVRTQAMAVLGMGMGVSFLAALVAGPVLSGLIGVPGIFLVTSVLALLAIPGVAFGVPAAPALPVATSRSVRAALTTPGLFNLNAGIFLLHSMMTCLFMAAPLALESTLGLPEPRHWEVYLPMLVLSVIPIFPLVRKAEQKGFVREAMAGAVVLMGIALCLAGKWIANADVLLLGMFLFFVAFNFLEGCLPSQISRLAPVDQKGAALGIYATCQFFGGFFGSALGGLSLKFFHAPGVFLAAACVALIWLPIVLRQRVATTDSAPSTALSAD